MTTTTPTTRNDARTLLANSGYADLPDPARDEAIDWIWYTGRVLLMRGDSEAFDAALADEVQRLVVEHGLPLAVVR